MKMNLVRYSILAAVLAMSVVPSGSVSGGQAPLTHALVHLTNNSSARATVYFRWGNSRWQKRVLARGESHYFNYPYKGTLQSSPDFFVRIDVDTTEKVRIVEHVLSRGASPDNKSPKFGHHFTIKPLAGTDTRYIEAAQPGATVTVTERNSSVPDVP